VEELDKESSSPASGTESGFDSTSSAWFGVDVDWPDTDKSNAERSNVVGSVASWIDPAGAAPVAIPVRPNEVRLRARLAAPGDCEAGDSES